MSRLLRWLQVDKFRAHSLALILMIVPGILLYYAASEGQAFLTWMLIASVVLGNLIALGVE